MRLQILEDLEMDYYNFDGLWFYDGEEIPENFKPIVEEIIISNNITSIGDYAFCGCENLTNIIIPNSVTSIGECAFEYCENLTSITISSSVTSIGGYAFYDCTSLASIMIPDSVTSIGNSAFGHCENLTSITIPNSVTSIGYDVFRQCDKLTIHTNNDYVINYCEENDISVEPLKSKNESLRHIKLKIREF